AADRDDRGCRLARRVAWSSAGSRPGRARGRGLPASRSTRHDLGATQPRALLGCEARRLDGRRAAQLRGLGGNARIRRFAVGRVLRRGARHGRSAARRGGARRLPRQFPGAPLAVVLRETTTDRARPRRRGVTAVFGTVRPGLVVSTAIFTLLVLVACTRTV